MDKLTHLKKSKDLVKRIANSRRYLHRTGKEGKTLSLNMQQTLLEIDYRMPVFNNFDKMISWISQRRVQASLTELMPSNHREQWKKELETIVFEGAFLQGRVAKQTELELTF